MASRNENRIILINKHEMYKKMRKERGIKHIRQFASPVLAKPTAYDVLNLDLATHIWSLGDKFYKLAYEYYGDTTYWWLIAWFNERPTEAHMKLGDLLTIPLPLEDVLVLYNDRY